MKLVSINIVNWNGLQLIGHCIDSIKLQTYKDIEINVIDNDSSDGSYDFLAKNYSEIKLVKNHRNEGFSKAHNQAIKISSGEYIIPLNFDIILTPNFVEEMVKAIESIESSSRIGIVSGKLYVLKNGEGTNTIDSTGITMQCMYPSDRGQNETDSGQYDRVEYIFGASGAAPLFSRKMLEDIKLHEEYFDEDFFIYVEDVDLCWRAQLYGWKALYTPSAIAYHHRGVTRQNDSGMKMDYIIIGYRNRYWSIVKNATLSGICKIFFWLFINELLVYIDCLLDKNYLILKVPFIALRGVTRMIRKRAMIQKNRKVTSDYMDRFFFDNWRHFIEEKFLKRLQQLKK